LDDTGPSLVFNEAIRFENLTFCYPGADRPALEAFDVEIHAGSTVGVVGPTGAGKTTAIDLLIGLLAPTSGRILIDGVPLDDTNRRAWQRGIGYVPQGIFLADASIAENIAFGEAPDSIDVAAVERAARIANIHDFISGQLPAGYDTKAGERGVRLSGGQRQRIGIARALYRNPPVLVFDEATSALDTETESAIIEAIERLRRVHTIVTIAHRLTTVRECDQIVLLEAGRISAQGDWETVTARSAMFRRMASIPGSIPEQLPADLRNRKPG
jgi:ABC-type multidrug transport system fused ATPase/permease subunit